MEPARDLILMVPSSDPPIVTDALTATSSTAIDPAKLLPMMLAPESMPPAKVIEADRPMSVVDTVDPSFIDVPSLQVPTVTTPSTAVVAQQEAQPL